jgi:hypothetical protein
MNTANINRIDIVNAIPIDSKKQYQVPCGMSSIWYLCNSKPTRKDILQLAEILKPHQVGLVSYYDYNEHDYRICSIVNPTIMSY